MAVESDSHKLCHMHWHTLTNTDEWVYQAMECRSFRALGLLLGAQAPDMMSNRIGILFFVPIQSISGRLQNAYRQRRTCWKKHMLETPGLT